MEKRYCLICGKEIAPNKGDGQIRRNARYCSDECRKKARALYTKKYINERYKHDEEFRKHRSNQSVQNAKRRRERMKADAIDVIAKHVREFKSDEEAAKYLAERVRVKADYAYGSKAL